MLVMVIGAGVAGTAAAWSAAQAGAKVTLIDGGVSASELSGGAVDDVPWEELERAEQASGRLLCASALSTAADQFVAALGLWEMVPAGARFARVITAAGRTRLTRGHEKGLLDLEQVPDGGHILLPRVPRAQWDADSLAHCLSCAPYARRRGLRFSAVKASLLRHIGDDRVSAAGLASFYDEDQPWLLARLQELKAAHPHAAALLCGPWLGADTALSPSLSTALNMPVGEVFSGLDSPHALRFRHARERLNQHAGIDMLFDHATCIQPYQDMQRVTLQEGGERDVDRVVLAIGGLTGGGVIYQPAFTHGGMDFPPSGKQPFRLSVATERVAFFAHDRPLRVTSSIHGPNLDDSAWPKDADPSLLEAVGIQTSGTLEAGPAGVWAAGDVLADRQRTIIAAVESGVRAGSAAVTAYGS